MHQLVRRYIGRRLSEYYAQPADRVVGKSSGAAAANLSSLLGEWHWRRLLRRFYEEREGHWLTPVELFQPHFSHVLGDFCCHAVETDHNNDGRHQLEIVELGGGQGTNANLILSYLREHKPEVYKGLSYTLVDSSPSLHRIQKQVLNDSEHADRVDFRLIDLMDVAERSVRLLDNSTVPTVVLAMEVLDNLPHDKTRAKSRKQLQQAEIHTNDNGVEQEIFVPLADPLLARAIKTVPSFVKPYPTWVPSVACGIIEHLIHQRPNLGLAFADFDWLPAPDLIDTDHLRLTAWGEGEPIVTDMDGVDHECFLQAPPHCDILFATDFEKLGSFTKRTISSFKRKDSARVQVEKQADFLERYGSVHVQKTKSWLTGHTPLLQDFVNCSVLTVTNSKQ